MASDLTPTETLVLEVLIARRRLGERLWTFDSNQAVRKAIDSLESKGLVNGMHGVTEHTVRASLTGKAEKAYLSQPYVAPRDAGDEKAAWKDYRSEASSRWVGGEVPPTYQEPFLAGFRAGRSG